jgi:tRNA uridine 5-carboxymethylaminomethyl modification enzyme
VAELGRRPGVPTGALLSAAGVEFDSETIEWADIELKYAGYLTKERAAAARLSQLNDFPLPKELAYSHMATLSFEAREKLERFRPGSLGDAARIPGVSPSDLQSLVFEVLRLGPVRPTADEVVSRETPC